MLITDPTEYEHAVSFLNESDAPISWDLETTSKDWRKARLCGIGSHCRERSFYMSFRHAEGPNLPERYIQDFFSRVLHPTRVQRTFHGSYDVKVAGHDGYELPQWDVFEDAILAALLMNENEWSFKMEDLAAKYVDLNAGLNEEELRLYCTERFGGSKKGWKGNLWRAPAEKVWPYGCQDVETTHRLVDFYLPHLERWKLLDLWREMNEFQLHIAKMEMRGVLIDVPMIEKLTKEADQKASRLLQRIQEMAGWKINPGSPKQLSAWLKLKSTAKHVLQRMQGDERAEAILEWRKWSKAGSTYYHKYPHHMDSDGVLRCNLHITSPGTKDRKRWDKRSGTISGRLSSSNPNLQQIPRGSDTYKVKNIFIARAGYKLVELDYSQAELRVAAHYSKDQRLTELLLAGEDMHDTVSQELGIPRHIAKNINFSAWYGIGYRTFARNYYLPESEARDFLSRYHKMFPGIRRLYNACEARAIRNGYIRLYTGRLRHYNDLSAPAYKASNNLIQGTVAEMVRRAIMRCGREVPAAPMVLTVHDSIWFEVPESTALETVAKLRRIMQEQPWCSLPLIVDAKMGTGFADAEDLPRDPAGIPQECLHRVTDWPRVFGPST